MRLRDRKAGTRASQHGVRVRDVIDADYRKRNSGLMASPSQNGHRAPDFLD